MASVTGKQKLCALGLLLLGLALRVPYLDDQPMQFHPMLHYENALVARVLWYRMSGEKLPADKQRWLDHWQGRFKAPPLVESLTALTYRLFDREMPVIGRLINVLLWVWSSILLYSITNRISQNVVAGLFAVGLFLIHPFGIIVSCSFQHESIMIFGLLTALWLLLRFDPAHLGGKCLLGVGLGACVALKPGFALFLIVAAYLSINIDHRGWKATFFSLSTYMVVFLALLPSILYALVVLDREEAAQIKGQLLLTSMFYQGWFDLLGRVIGWALILAGIIGTAFLAIKQKKSIGIMLILGYLAYAGMFNYASMTHDYYHIILLPILALCAAPLAGYVWEFLSGFLVFTVARMALILILCVLGIFCGSAAWPVLRSRYEVPIERYERLGQQLGHGTRVVSLNPSPDYGMPLQYYGLLNALWWPTQADLWKESLDGRPLPDPRQRLDQMLSRWPADYFVITDLEEFRQQPELKKYLNTRYQKVESESQGVMIFSLRGDDR